MRLRKAYSIGQTLAELCSVQANQGATVSVKLIIISTSTSTSRACEANIKSMKRIITTSLDAEALGTNISLVLYIIM